ncbi:HAD family hydrolase [Hydrocarboniphaga effusa]|jgi:phosphoglycolate phosphatase|uniref:HAD family hydrolase n=1 Tax=Hydrocarboniphaga effusa TaxID=243629 RepID=UPI0035AFAA6C
MSSTLRRRYRGIVFDLDGTLLDTRAGMIEAINAVLREHKLQPVDAQDLAHSVHFGLDAMLRQALELRGSGESVEALARQVRQRYLRTASESVRLFDGARELLTALSAERVWLAICSNQSQESAMRLLASFGIAGYFDAVAGGDTLERRKPDPLPLQWLLDRGGLRPNEVLMIGDSDVDRRCAEAAGVDVVLMEHGYGLAEVTEPCARWANFRAVAGELVR